MVDPVTAAVGSAASILQLVGNVSKGLRLLRDTVGAIKDAPTVVKHIEENIHMLEDYFNLVNEYMKQTPSGIPDEIELRRVLQDLINNCQSPLSVLQERISSHNAKNRHHGVQAFHLWINDRTIKQALNHIYEYRKHLFLLLEALNL